MGHGYRYRLRLITIMCLVVKSIALYVGPDQLSLQQQTIRCSIAILGLQGSAIENSASKDEGERTNVEGESERDRQTGHEQTGIRGEEGNRL